MTSIFKDLAQEYPFLTDETNRLAREIPLIDSTLRQAKVSSLLDLGCATGAHSAALNGLGYQVRGIDINDEMILTARRRFGSREDLSFETTALSEESNLHREHYDAVLCLGNTFPQIVYAADLAGTLGAIGNLLRNGGLFIGQIVNPNWIRSVPARILPVRDIPARDSYGRTLFLRTYMILNNDVILTLIRLEELSAGRWEKEIFVERMAEINRAPLESALRSCGFSEFVAYESYDRSKFNDDSSQSLIWIAKKVQPEQDR